MMTAQIVSTGGRLPTPQSVTSVTPGTTNTFGVTTQQQQQQYIQATSGVKTPSSPVKLEPQVPAQQQQQQPSPLVTKITSITSSSWTNIRTSPTHVVIKPQPATSTNVISTGGTSATSSGCSIANTVASVAAAAARLDETGGAGTTVGGGSKDDFDSGIGDVAASNKISTNLDQIKACKDEKFLNILVLHKKFVDLG